MWNNLGRIIKNICKYESDVLYLWKQNNRDMKDIQEFINDLLDYKSEKEIVYASSVNKNGSKELGFKGDGFFYVKLNKEVILTCGQPFDAVEKYLSITL